MLSKDTVFSKFPILAAGCFFLLGSSVGVALAPFSSSSSTPSPAPQAAVQTASQLARIEQALSQLVEAHRVSLPSPGMASENTSAVQLDTAVLHREISRVVRAELQVGLASLSPEAATIQAQERAEATLLSTVENSVAYAEAHDILRVAQLDGRWTDEDASALRATLANLTSDQRMEILDPLIIALNQETIQQETTGPLF